MTTFFVPEIEPDAQEAAYADLAKFCEHVVPDKRVYSITFMHDSEEWTATVGESLRGVRTKGKQKLMLSDPATVLAIFPGYPFKVVTNAWAVRSAWENPFLAGNPTSITYFD